MVDEFNPRYMPEQPVPVEEIEQLISERQTDLLPENNKVFDDVAVIKSTDVVYICGGRETGKSYFMEKLAQKYTTTVVVYDGATHQHANMGELVRTPEELKEKLKAGSRAVVCQSWKDSQEVFDKFCKVVWDNGNICLMVEEVGNYCDSYSAGEYFDMLTRVGRNRGVGIVAINQRPARIWNNFVALIQHWIIFNTELPNDIKFLGEYIGQPKAEACKNLPDRYFYYKKRKTEAIKCNPIK